jgi:hypothetical protein
MLELKLGKLEETCGTCKGAGVVGSEEWARWLRRFEHEEKRLESVRPALERGVIVDGAVAYAGPEPTEPEEPECPECWGRKYVPTDLGAELLTFIRRYS